MDSSPEIGYRRGERGFVLVSVLWILAILTVVSVGFAHRAMLERKMAWYALDQMQAQMMARGAVERAVAEIFNKSEVDRYYGGGAQWGLEQHWAQPLDLLEEGGYYTDDPEHPLEGESCVFRIQDCDGRISINHASEEMLSEVEGLSFQVVRRVMARRETRSTNEEVIPYFTMDELRGADGIGEDDWYGRRGGEGLRDVLTVWGTGMLNINTARQAALACVPGLDKGVATTIVEYRAGDDGKIGTPDDHSFKTLEEVAERTGLSPEKIGDLNTYCTVGSTYFTIEACATRRQGKIRAYCTSVITTATSSPFSDQVQETQTVLYWREGVLGS